MSTSGDLVSADGLLVTGQLVNIAVRAVLVYTGGFILIRLGKNRLLGRSTPFDIVLGIVLGSLLSRAINGTATVADTIMAAGTLIGFHACVSWLSRRSPAIEQAIKGRHALLVREGTVLTANMRRANLSSEDLEEALRLRGGITEAAGVSRALLERNGEISVIRKGRPAPHVVDVHVEEGVQTVRIELL